MIQVIYRAKSLKLWKRMGHRLNGVIREWHLTLTPEQDPQRVIHLFEEHFIFHLGSLSIKDMCSEHFIDHLTQL